MSNQRELALNFTRSLLSDAMENKRFQAKDHLRNWSDFASHKTKDIYDLLDKKDQKFFGGLFVTLKIAENLRGCIGRMWNDGSAFLILPVLSLETAFHDYRFKSLSIQELPLVTISHSILSVPRNENSWKDIRLGEEGIILSLGQRRAVFLPEVAQEQGWTLEQTLSHLSVKAGLHPKAYLDEEAEFKVFTSYKYSE